MARRGKTRRGFLTTGSGSCGGKICGLRREMKNIKHQTPNTKETPNIKHQTRGVSISVRLLKFGIWNFLGVWCLVFGVSASARAATSSAAAVTLRESEKTFFLVNGIMNARIEKSSGEIFSIKYHGVELLAQDSAGGALGGYWSSVGRARPGGKREGVGRSDAKSNGGERVA